MSQWGHPLAAGLVFGMAALAASPLSAAKTHPKAGSTSASFLKIGVGAKPIAMGEAYTAVAQGPEGVYWNPAALAEIDRPELSGMHQISFQSIHHTFVGYARPWRTGAFAFSATGLFVPSDLERRSGTGENVTLGPDFTNPEGSFGANDLAFAASYGTQLSGRLGWGGTLKWIRQSIDSDSGSTFAADLGATLESRIDGLRYGASILHVGPGVRFGTTFDLPLTLRFGAAYSGWANENLLVSADVSKPIDNYPILGVGAEFKLFDMLFLRGGYRYRWFGNALGGTSGLRAGGGIFFQGFRLDYAFAPFGDLGDTHRISINLRFDVLAREPKKEPRPENPSKIVEPPPPPLPAAPETVVALPKETVTKEKYLDLAMAEFPAQTRITRIGPGGADYILKSTFPARVFLESELRVRMPGEPLAKVLYAETAKIPDPENLPEGAQLFRAVQFETFQDLPVRAGQIRFSVPQGWLAEKALEPGHVNLVYRDNEGRWVFLKTEFLPDQPGEPQFRSYIHDLGVFLILGKKAP